MSDLHSQPPEQLAERPKLNPAQQQVTDDLGATPEQRPSFRDDLRDHLRHEIEESLNPLLTDVPNLPLVVWKRDLSTLHDCEARYVAEKDADFVWTVPMAKGSVAHKAIELLVTWRGEPTPLELVDEAIARLEHSERGVGTFIKGLGEAERAELSGKANDFVATFVETFPALNRRWVPVAESNVRAELCEDQLGLHGRVDLTLGRAYGNVAGKVLIDFKTGRPNRTHLDDLRFYALLETLKVGVPPRLLVNYYLEAGQPRREEVTEDLLWSTAKRLIDGVAKRIELEGRAKRAPIPSPGLGCRWCAGLDGCDTGRQHLTSVDDEDTA
jgi:hypothetical protein